MRLFFALFFLAMFTMHCKKQKQVTTEVGSTKLVESPTTAIPGITVMSDGGINLTSDAFKLEEAIVSGDTLIVTVSFGGGCKEHEFEVYANGMWMKSLPPKMALRLVHRAHEDNCRSYITQTRKFLLHKARYSGQNKVVILLDSGGEVRSLDYKYP
jgi:hypothetical protein